MKTGRDCYFRFVCLLLAELIGKLSQTDAAGNRNKCRKPLGMESGDIPNSAILVSSNYLNLLNGSFARLRLNNGFGAWCPRNVIQVGSYEYIEITLKSVHQVTAVQTQGREHNGRGQEYVPEYYIEYKRPDSKLWRLYRTWDNIDVFKGNDDTTTVATNELYPSIFASVVRIVPFSIYPRSVCLRLELLGCRYDGDIISYNLTIDPSWDINKNLGDESHDGENHAGYRTNGLGRLVDGLIGLDNFSVDVSRGIGIAWVTWNAESFKGDFIELRFLFGHIRRFHSIYIYCNNNFKMNTQIFSEARVKFSIGGVYYNGEEIHFIYDADDEFIKSRNVQINLNGNIGKYVKINIYFRKKMVAISEVTFDSVIAVAMNNNYTPESGPARGDKILKMFSQNSYPTEALNELETGNSEVSETNRLYLFLETVIIFLILFTTILVVILMWLIRSYSFQTNQVEEESVPPVLYVAAQTDSWAPVKTA